MNCKKLLGKTSSNNSPASIFNSFCFNLSTISMNKHKEKNINFSSSTSNKLYFKTSKKNFALYFPKKELIYVKHPYYGDVYPIYMASKTKDNIKRITFYSLAAFTIISLNSYFLFLNLGLISLSQSKLLLLSSNSSTLLSFIVLGYWVKTYLKYVSDLSHKVRNMYLLPSGKKVIVERFNGDTDVVLNADIYSSNIYNSTTQESRKEKFYDNNHNSFYAVVSYGRNKEVIFDGNILFLDYEIFSYVTGRFNIETSQIGFNREKVEAPISTQFIKNNKILADKIKKQIKVKRYSLEYLKHLYINYVKTYNLRRSKLSFWFGK